jgi:hypothetical protein
MFAFVSVSSACIAAPSELIHFTLRADRGLPAIQASFESGDGDRNRNHWSSGFKPSELIGLDVNGFYTAGAKPLRFAVVREAGRLDCAGNGGGASASGDCGFAENPAFVKALVDRGISRPNREQALGLMALDVRRELIDALAAARYPTPSVNELMELTAVGVDRGYIGGLAGAGYRPSAIHTLTEFKALDIDPNWIGDLRRAGYADVPADQLVQLKAMDVGADFIGGFQRLGYRHLPVDTLVQFKALDITPAFVRSAVGARGTMPPVGDLVEMKLFGRAR